jgi:hypothetical protein
MNNKFNLERAIAGEPLETMAGEPVEFVAYRPTAKKDEQLIMQVGTDIRMYHADGRFHNLFSLFPYNLRMKHVLRKIDWSDIPEDTVISTPEGDRHIAKCYKNSTLVLTYPKGKSSLTYGLRELEEHYKNKCYLVEQQPWTVWQGGECPIPDGLEFEYITHDYPRQVMVGKESTGLYVWTNYSVYAYRLTGRVLDGWTL